MLWRIQKILARAGVAARRKAEEVIRDGRVTVNGRVAHLGESANPENDVIAVDGQRVRLQKSRYLVYNKPKGVVVSAREEGHTTLFDMLNLPKGVFSVGRLDKDSEGLLLLTNDGDFANRMTHPRFGIEKEYRVVLNRPLEERDRARVERGIPLDGRPVHVRLSGKGMLLSAVIHEGRKHVIRRLFKRIGYDVLTLRRVRLGPLRLQGLPNGTVRQVTDQERLALVRATERS